MKNGNQRGAAAPPDEYLKFPGRVKKTMLIKIGRCSAIKKRVGARTFLISMIHGGCNLISSLEKEANIIFKRSVIMDCSSSRNSQEYIINCKGFPKKMKYEREANNARKKRPLQVSLAFFPLFSFLLESDIFF